MKLAAVLVLVLAVSLHVSLVSAKGGPCSALKLPAVQKSKTFDLSSLAGQTFSATAQSDGGSTTFNWAICESIACDGKTAGTCQTVVTGGSSYTGVAALWDPNNVVAIAPDGGALGIGVQETNTFVRGATRPNLKPSWTFPNCPIFLTSATTNLLMFYSTGTLDQYPRAL